VIIISWLSKKSEAVQTLPKDQSRVVAIFNVNGRGSGRSSVDLAEWDQGLLMSCTGVYAQDSQAASSACLPSPAAE